MLIAWRKPTQVIRSSEIARLMLHRIKGILTSRPDEQKNDRKLQQVLVVNVAYTVRRTHHTNHAAHRMGMLQRNKVQV